MRRRNQTERWGLAAWTLRGETDAARIDLKSAALSMPLVSKSEQGQAALVSRRRSQRSTPLKQLLWHLQNSSVTDMAHTPRAPNPDASLPIQPVDDLIARFAGS